MKEQTQADIYRNRRITRSIGTNPAELYEMEKEGCSVQISPVEKKFVAELLDVNITTIGGEIFISSDKPFTTPTDRKELFNFRLVAFAKDSQERNGDH